MSLTKARSYRLTKTACYIVNVAMAAVGAMSPLLFVTFRNLYGISYTLLGLLVVINFCTQLLIDVLFTFFSSRFDLKLIIRIMPALTVAGMLIYAIMPNLFPDSAYLWLALGTVIFSASAGLCEVLISPVIAAIPSNDPERDMSMLHSSYAWGLVIIAIVGTLFLKLFGSENWMFMTLIFSLIPIVALVLFAISPIPDMNGESESQKGTHKIFSVGIMLCVFCIFLGGAAEGAMTQWISSYIENALGIPKMVGDILGMAMFAAMLGLGRTLYAKYGKNIINFMIFGMISSFVCYLTASLVLNAYVGLFACVITGFCVSMLWPGSIILVGEKFSGIGVAAYALMAAGGDLGTSVAPQLVGAVADGVASSEVAARLSQTLSLTTEQIGMRAGLLTASIFSALGAIVIISIKIYFKKRRA